MRRLMPLVWVVAAASLLGVSFVTARVAPEPIGWYIARSAGLLTYGALTLSMAFGLTIALRGSLPGLPRQTLFACTEG
ncbi:MAG TPA: hypothetical protein QGF05_10745 [Dehalococcoidia bacterium]|nr:hypothetical protein [Dehalococcoidia bacterium]